MNGYDFITDVSCSTDKLIFLYQAIKNRRHIAAFHWNDVFCEYCDLFYKNKPHNTALQNFKKWMKVAAENKGHKVVVGIADQIDRVDFGMRRIWSIEYSINNRTTNVNQR